MNLRIWALIVVLVAAAGAGGWFFLKPTNHDLSAYSTIRFGVDAPYPPYEFFNASGELTGFEVDLGNAACEYLKVRCEWIVTGWDDIIPDLNAGKFDIIMSSMSINNERKEFVDFGKPYYSTPSVFFARKGEQIGGTAVRHFRGRVIAVQRGTLQHDYVLKEYGDAVTVMALDGWDEISAAFRAAEADIVFTDYPQWEGEFFLERVYEILGEPVKLGEGVGLAFRKQDDNLRAAFNEALDELKSNGEYQRFRRKYFFYEIIVE